MTTIRPWATALIFAAALMLPAVACMDDDASPREVGARAVAVMSGPGGESMGKVTLEQGPNGVLVSADVEGLSAGPHGFHIHGVGACAPDFTAAGDHFNPEGIGHGLMHEGGAHAGDLPNIYANDAGFARADHFTGAVTFDSGVDHSLFDADGSAIIVHEKPDTYGAEPGAGDRVACGVIERQ